MDFLQKFLNIFIDLFITLLILRAVLSWVVQDQRSALMRFLSETTEPIVGPVRRALPRTGMIDLSPLIVLLVLQFLKQVINSFF